VQAELRAHRGKQWDPEIVDLALRLIQTGELVLGTGGLRMIEPELQPATPQGLAVLLVEDDDMHARLVSEALMHELAGVVIARATSVAHAAELQSGSEWSIAVIAHRLPDGPGVDVLDALRAANPALPIVMLTSQGSEETVIEAFQHGASDYAVKGTSYDALALRVRGLVAA
jgi:two-component system response regulator VicR